MTYRCLDCGSDFYVEESEEKITDELIREAEGRVIDDGDALQATEEEINRQIEEDDGRRCL